MSAATVNARAMDLAVDIRTAANELLALLQSGQPSTEEDNVELDEALSQLNTVVARVDERE